MFECAICHHTESREELVEKMFHVDERYVLVERIPVACARCCEPPSVERRRSGPVHSYTAVQGLRSPFLSKY